MVWFLATLKIILWDVNYLSTFYFPLLKFIFTFNYVVYVSMWGYVLHWVQVLSHLTRVLGTELRVLGCLEKQKLSNSWPIFPALFPFIFKARGR